MKSNRGAKMASTTPSRGVTAGQRVSDNVLGAGFVFHREVESEKLADPMVLWDCCEALVESRLEGGE
jgi:hypothetical protein